MQSAVFGVRDGLIRRSVLALMASVATLVAPVAAQAVVEVEPEQGAHLAGTALAEVTGTRPYLVRAIACHVGGSFPVFQSADGTLWVQHIMTQSQGQLPEAHRAVVVLLARPPAEEAYANCLRKR